MLAEASEPPPLNCLLRRGKHLSNRLGEPALANGVSTVLRCSLRMGSLHSTHASVQADALRFTRRGVCPHAQPAH